MVFDMPTQEELDQRREAKRVPTPKAGWAKKAARNGVQYISCITDDEVYSLIAKLLKAEHARAIRIVKAEIKYAAHAEQKTKLNRELNAYWQGKLDGAENILAALQRGRGGKG